MQRMILGLGILVLVLVGGCREEGAAEKAGRKLDRALEELQHPNEGPLERLGRKTDEALEDARRAVKSERKGD
jgi:hypothetical protein